ncbi:TPA: MFS transporter [Streptococcus suis]|uniref:MFS transporter n=1 Tax=Streptococcus suis TaxID=1307 RepID=UPI0027B9D83B|nr:MFS transporter [Streptococcus suis]
MLLKSKYILSLFLLPYFGALSDRFNSRNGKRIPFVFLGSLLTCFGLVLLPYATSHKLFWLFNLGLGLVLFAMSISRAPAIALMPDLTSKPLRSKANAIINLMGAVGAILTLIALALLVDKSDQPDYTDLFLTVGLILLVSFAILRWKIDEKKWPSQSKTKSKRLEERASSTRKSRFPFFSCWCPSSCGS